MHQKICGKNCQFFSHREVLVAYLLLWIYITVARVDFMILQKMYIVMNKRKFFKNLIKTHFSPKRFRKFLSNSDMLNSASYLIFLPIFKLLARAVNLLDTYLLVCTRVFISLNPILQQKATAWVVDLSHPVAKGARFAEVWRQNWQKA